MPPRRESPSETSVSFAAAINSGDLQAAREHWMPDAVLVGPDGGEARGAQEIGERLAALIASDVKLQIVVEAVVQSTHAALGTTRMLMTVPGVSDKPLQLRGTVVYELGEDGWQFAIDTLATPASGGAEKN